MGWYQNHINQIIQNAKAVFPWISLLTVSTPGLAYLAERGKVKRRWSGTENKCVNVVVILSLDLCLETVLIIRDDNHMISIIKKQLKF